MNVSDEIRQLRAEQRATVDDAPRLLLEALKRDCVNALSSALGEFVAGLQRAGASLDSVPGEAQGDRAGSASVVNDGFLRVFRDRIDAGLSDWASGSMLAASPDRSLRLLSEAQLEMQLTAQTVAEDLEVRCSRSLDTLDARMANLAGALRCDAGKANPLRPAAIVDAFIAGFGDRDIATELRDRILLGLKGRLNEVLPPLYGRCNQLLQDGGIQATAPAARKPATQAAPVPAPPPPARGEGAVSEWVPSGGTVEPMPAGRPAPMAMPSAPMPAQQGAGLAAQAHQTAPADTWVPDGGMVEAVRRDVPTMIPSETLHAETRHAPVPQAGGLLRFRDIMRPQLRQWRASTFEAANDSAVDCGGTVLSTAGLVSVASMLQGEKTPVFAMVLSGRDARPLATAIREQVADAAQRLGLASGPTRLEEDEQDAIDLVGMLFQSLVQTRFASARGQPARATELYARLVVPYLRVALVDDSLFNHRGHPARRLLDALTDVCEYGDDTARRCEVLDFAGTVVDRVVDKFREDVAILQMAADELRQFHDQRRHRVELQERRAAEALHGRERLRVARDAARGQVTDRLALRPLAAPVATFLQVQWNHALEQAWLREGGDSPRWRELVTLGEELVALDRDAAACAGGDIAARWNQLSAAVVSVCSNAGLDPSSTYELQAQIVHALAHPEARRVVHDMPESEAGASDDAMSGPLRIIAGTEQVDFNPAIAARVRRLRVGHTLSLQTEDGRCIPVRVAWISPLTSRLLITDRRGMRQLIASPEQLAQMMAMGRVVVREAGTAFDEAMRGVWEQLSSPVRERRTASA